VPKTKNGYCSTAPKKFGLFKSHSRVFRSAPSEKSFNGRRCFVSESLTLGHKGLHFKKNSSDSTHRGRDQTAQVLQNEIEMRGSIEV